MENLTKAKKALTKELKTLSFLLSTCNKELLDNEQATIYKHKIKRVESLIIALDNLEKIY